MPAPLVFSSGPLFALVCPWVNCTYHHVQEDAERSHAWAGKEATQTQNGCREVSHFDPRYMERKILLCGPDEVHLHHEDDDDP